jgi:hypothetical protein
MTETFIIAVCWGSAIVSGNIMVATLLGGVLAYRILFAKKSEAP